MSLSALLIMNERGDTVLGKFYREDIGHTVNEAFRHQVIYPKETKFPVKQISQNSFLFVQESDLFVVGVTRQNADVAVIFEVLHTFIKNCKLYFGGDFDEESVRGNFLLVYEILEEILDWGFPQLTDPDALKLYITQTGYISEKTRTKMVALGHITSHTTGAMPWRAPNIHYKQNEVYLDVIESVNLHMSSTGTVLRADVSGKILMKCLLSGMPECKFGMNDKILMENEAKQGKSSRAKPISLDDVTLHQCVKLGKFDTERTVTFCPPDGEFELMTYRSTENINLPFKVISSIKEIGRTRIEAEISVKSNYDYKLTGLRTRIVIPTPKNTATVKVLSKTGGKAVYDPDVGGIAWRIKRFPGGVEHVLRAEVELLSGISTKETAWSRPPISMEFNVPMFTASRLQIRYLHVSEKSGYQTTRWVRYLTKAGAYQHRI